MQPSEARESDIDRLIRGAESAGGEAEGAEARKKKRRMCSLFVFYSSCTCSVSFRTCGILYAFIWSSYRCFFAEMVKEERP